MARVGVWKVQNGALHGALFVTPDAVGFGYYSDDQFAQLHADLEDGVSVGKAAGFSGNVYPLAKLRSVEIKPNGRHIFVRFRDFLGGGKDDYTFKTAAACEEFCEVLLDNLGPGWQRGPMPKPSFWLMAILVFAIVITLFFVAVSIGLMFTRPGPQMTPENAAGAVQAGMVCGGVSLVVAIAFLFLAYLAVKRPPRVDAIHQPPR